MPSQPKTDPTKLRSQISRRVDSSFPVFARLVWHAGHADREASWFGMSGMPGMKLQGPRSKVKSGRADNDDQHTGSV